MHITKFQKALFSLVILFFVGITGAYSQSSTSEVTVTVTYNPSLIVPPLITAPTLIPEIVPMVTVQPFHLPGGEPTQNISISIFGGLGEIYVNGVAYTNGETASLGSKLSLYYKRKY